MKRETALVTDTTACVPLEQVRELDIGVVPVQLIINNKTYRDGIDISPADFYTMIRNSENTLTTSSSSPAPYMEAYINAAKNAKNILCITEPARFSAMRDSALVARNNVLEMQPGVNIEVMECTTAAAGQGLAVLAAARAAARNETIEKVKDIAASTMASTHLFAALDTLNFLVKSGRVPQAAALVNSLLNIKPIFTINHSDAHTVALPRTTKSAMDNLLKLMEQHSEAGRTLHVAVMHADVPDMARSLHDRIAAMFNCSEIYITEFTPVMGVHTGPGLIGVAFYND